MSTADLRLVLLLVLLVFTSAIFAACNDAPLPSRRGYALYRGSEIVGDPVYLATFDAEDSPPFNQANCEDTARLATENAARYPAKLRYFCVER
jgi:hypothetical protein